jgi:hypothetical protein
LIECLPDDVEEFCKANEITVDYFIEEFMWLYKNKNFNSYRAALELSCGIKSQSDKELKILNIWWLSLIIIQEGVDHLLSCLRRNKTGHNKSRVTH